jgi:hypothetical protein
MSTPMTLTAICGIGLFLFFATWFGFSYWRGVRKSRASRTWHRVTSQVLESGVAGGTDDDSPRPYADYEYQVGGRTYRNNRIFLVDKPGGNARAIAAQYPAGRQVEVYYNPNNPAEAALVRNTPSAALYLGLALVMLLGAAVTCGLYGFLSLCCQPVTGI